jgi:galactonate dehydratase
VSMHDIDTSVTFCRTIREAVGNQADLLFGTHGQFSTAGAIRIGQALEPFSPLWYEEPTPPDADMSAVTSAVRVPVATGERLTTKSEFVAALKAGVQILQPALGRAGGIWEAKKIAVIAETYNAQMAPHLYAGPIEWAANIQLAASIPNILMAETIETDFHFALIKNSLSVEGGYIPVPTAAGLGIDVDEDLARAHPYDGDGLHLQMQNEPISYHEVNNFAGGAPVKA